MFFILVCSEQKSQFQLWRLAASFTKTGLNEKKKKVVNNFLFKMRKHDAVMCNSRKFWSLAFRRNSSIVFSFCSLNHYESLHRRQMSSIFLLVFFKKSCVIARQASLQVLQFILIQHIMSLLIQMFNTYSEGQHLKLNASIRLFFIF